MNEVKQHVSASDVRISEGLLHFAVDGNKYAVRLAEISEKLKTATDAELNLFQISPSGYGIHWPLIDEDISFKGLIADRAP